MELCSRPAIYLGPNYGGDNEDNGDLLQKIPCMYCYTKCPKPCSRPPLTHASTGDSWTLTGKSGSVSCGITAPFSWVLVHTRFCLCPPRVCFLVLCKVWQLCGGVNGDLLQEGLCHTQSPWPCGRPLLTHVRDKPNPVWIRTHLNGASLVAQMVNILPAVQDTRVQSLGRKDPLEKGMAIHSNRR